MGQKQRKPKVKHCYHVRKVEQIRELIRQGFSDAQIALRTSSSVKVVAYERFGPMCEEIPNGAPLTDREEQDLDRRIAEFLFISELHRRAAQTVSEQDPEPIDLPLYTAPQAARRKRLAM